MKTVSKSNYAEVLEIACSVLDLSFKTIQEKYAGILPICISKYIEKEEQDNIIEIRFDDAKTTLSCSFNEENQCDASFLFFDDTNSIEHIISFMNSYYSYDFIRSRWILPECYLAIKPTKTDIHIMIYNTNEMQ